MDLIVVWLAYPIGRIDCLLVVVRDALIPQMKR